MEKKVDYIELIKFTGSLLSQIGLDDFSNDSVTTGLCETSLRGIDSHGIRLLPHYVNSALSGRKNPKPIFKITEKYPTSLFMDADNAFGHAAGMKAIEIGMEKADQFGICSIGVGNSSHPGAMASYALRAAREGYIAFAFTHADSLLLSTNSKIPFFGTNPICMAAPRKDMEPYCLDMATSTVSWNKILLHRSNKEKLPEGIAADESGLPTTDPHKARSILPTGGYKGYGLSSMVEVLCGVFTGMNFGHAIPSMYKAPMNKGRGLGQFYMVMKADSCVGQMIFEDQLAQMTEEVSREPRSGNDKVILPGDREIKISKERMENGIPLDIATAQKLSELSKTYKSSLLLRG